MPGRRGEPVRRRDHAERPAQLRARRERGSARGTGVTLMWAHAVRDLPREHRDLLRSARFACGSRARRRSPAGRPCSSGITLRSSGGRRRPIPGSCSPRSLGRRRRVRIGTAVTPVARRRPQVLAQTVASLDVLSGGRVVFGAGLGGAESEFGKFGEPTDAKVRAAMLDEGLGVLRALWSGAEVRHRGEHYTVDGVTLAPTSGAGAGADLDRRQQAAVAATRGALGRVDRRQRRADGDDAEPGRPRAQHRDDRSRRRLRGRRARAERPRRPVSSTRGPVRRGGSRTCTTGAAHPRRFWR